MGSFPEGDKLIDMDGRADQWNVRIMGSVSTQRASELEPHAGG